VSDTDKWISVSFKGATIHACEVLRAEGNVLRFTVGAEYEVHADEAAHALNRWYGISEVNARRMVQTVIAAHAEMYPPVKAIIVGPGANLARLMAEIAESVPESEEPPLCTCGKHYIGAPCPLDTMRDNNASLQG
jgi:hypothetical protein